MANFSKILGLAGTAAVFAGMAFGQNISCTSTPAYAAQTPLVRVEGTTELVGEYTITCSGGSGSSATVNILDIVSLPVTSKVLSTSTGATEAVAVVSGGSTYQGTVSGSQVSFSNVVVPSGGATITIANIRVNATSLTVGTGTPPAITESAFLSGTNFNSSVTASVPVAYAFTGLKSSTIYTSSTLATKGSNPFLVCQAYSAKAAQPGLVGYLDVGENFATAFKGAQGYGSTTNTTLGSEFTNNSESGYVVGSNAAATGTMLQIVFSSVPAQVSALYVPTSVIADQTTGGTGTLFLATSPSNLTIPTASTGSGTAPAGVAPLTISGGSATAYYVFVPGANSSTTLESFAVPIYIVQSANSSSAVAGTMTAVTSFAPVGSSQIPNFVIGASSTTTTLSAFSQCSTSLLFPFVTNQLGFDTGIAIANTSTDPFGSTNGATPQNGTCTLNFYGAGAPSPNNITTASIASGTVYTGILSGLAAGFQGYMIAQCTFQYAHGFAFITDGVGANGGLSQGYLAGVIPDVNQIPRSTANPIGATKGGSSNGTGESLGN
jgi:hypothetical protein